MRICRFNSCSSHCNVMARSSIGTGHRPLTPERRVQFPHGLLSNMTKWRNWKTRDAQNVVPQGMGVRPSPWSLRNCRRGRCPTGFHTAGRPVRYRGLQLRVGQCSARPHKPGPPGATPGPAMTGYANWHSGEVESLVPVGSTPTSVTGMIPWSNGKDAWMTTRKAVVRLHPGSLVKRRSVGVSAAHLLGTAEDRVRLPDGPLELLGWHVPWRRLILARSVR